MGVFISSRFIEIYPEIRTASHPPHHRNFRKKMTITDPKLDGIFAQSTLKCQEEKALIFCRCSTVHLLLPKVICHIILKFRTQLEFCIIKKIRFLNSRSFFFSFHSRPINYHIEKKMVAVEPLSFGNW